MSISIKVGERSQIIQSAHFFSAKFGLSFNLVRLLSFHETLTSLSRIAKGKKV